MLWTIRYKRLGPVETAVIETKGSEQARAQAVAEAWCARESVRFINVRPFIAADETILVAEVPAMAPPVPPAVQGGKGRGA